MAQGPRRRTRHPGHTYQQIADELGYANRGTVHRLVQQTLHAHQADSVDTLRALEVARLDALQQALWEPALTGDLRAVGQVVQIVVARSRLLGLMPLGKKARDGPLAAYSPRHELRDRVASLALPSHRRRWPSGARPAQELVDARDELVLQRTAESNRLHAILAPGEHLQPPTAPASARC